MGLDRAGPVLWKNPGAHVTMKRRMRPILDAADQTMLYWIDVAVFDMAGEVSLVTDQVLPEAPLPDAAFVAREPDGADAFLLRQFPCKTIFDQAPTGREIGIAGR